jgi:histidine ammonia-lyase
MGTNAANATARVLANTDRVLAIGALALAQAVDISGAEAKLSRDGKAFHGTIRAVSAPITSTSDPASCILAVEEAIFRPTPTWQK